jgi:hypothetical protein
MQEAAHRLAKVPVLVEGRVGSRHHESSVVHPCAFWAGGQTANRLNRPAHPPVINGEYPPATLPRAAFTARNLIE